MGEALYAAAYAHLGIIGPQQCSVAVEEIAKMDYKNRTS